MLWVGDQKKLMLETSFLIFGSILRSNSTETKSNKKKSEVFLTVSRSLTGLIH